MFKIGEFSKLVRVSPRMLRHYEKCGLIYPAEIDRFTGYRQYSAKQIPLIGRIVALRDMGFGIDEIADILPRMEDIAYMDKILLEKTKAIRSVIDSEDEKLHRIEMARMNLKKERKVMKYDVILKELPAIKVLSLRDTIPSYNREGDLWQRMGEHLKKEGINVCMGTEEHSYSFYHDNDYKDSDVDVEIAFPVASLGKDSDGFTYRELEAIPLAATLRFSGPYEGTQAATEFLANWIEKNGYETTGLLRSAMIQTPADQSNPENFLTELQFPVRKA